MDANTTAFLNTLGWCEGATYNTLCGGGTFSDYSQFPQWAGVTVNGQISHAAGKYQFEPATWAALQQQLSLPDFSPASQDAAALQLITNQGAAAAVSAGDTTTAASLLNSQWASLPGSTAGQGGGKTIDQVNSYFTSQGGTLATSPTEAAGSTGVLSDAAQNIWATAQTVGKLAVSSDYLPITIAGSAIIFVLLLLAIFLPKKKAT